MRRAFLSDWARGAWRVAWADLGGNVLSPTINIVPALSGAIEAGGTISVGTNDTWTFEGASITPEPGSKMYRLFVGGVIDGPQSARGFTFGNDVGGLFYAYQIQADFTINSAVVTSVWQTLHSGTIAVTAVPDWVTTDNGYGFGSAEYNGAFPAGVWTLTDNGDGTAAVSKDAT